MPQSRYRAILSPENVLSQHFVVNLLSLCLGDPGLCSAPIVLSFPKCYYLNGIIWDIWVAQWLNVCLRLGS